MPIKIPFGVVAVLAAVCASILALCGWREAEGYRTLAQEQTRKLEDLEARMQRVHSNLQRVEANYATQELRLRQALATVPDARTPDAVYNLLCERGRCLKLDPLPAPTD